jgi:RNA polymerase sigma-70 factor (ECF subfamily)
VYESDRDLVVRMRAGEQRAFDEFFRSSAPRLAAFVARRSGWDAASVEDIVQNTLIKAVRNLGSYRGEAALFTWLTTICRRELADVARKAARQPGHDSLDGPSAALPDSLQLRIPAFREPAAEVAAASDGAAIARALNALPERYALALEAKYGDGLSVDEIAHLLGLTPIATQSLLARARDAFRALWRESGDEMLDGSDRHD